MAGLGASPPRLFRFEGHPVDEGAEEVPGARSMPRLAVATTLLLLLVALGGCGVGGYGDDLKAAVPDGGTGTSESMSPGELAWAQEVLDLVNQERARVQAQPVEWHAEATTAAYGHSIDMDARNFFAHDNPDGDGPGERLRAAGVDWGSYGENIAVGQKTPQDVMAAWMDSDGHRRNILDPRFTHLGIGVHTSYEGGPWWTQNFVR